MVDVYDPKEDEVEEKHGLDLDANAAPEPVSVYERPERTGTSTSSLVIAIIAILVLAVLAYFVFFVIL